MPSDLCDHAPVKSKIGSYLIDVACGAIAYVAARWIWGDNTGVFHNIHWELLTFGLIYLLLQALLRGRKLAEKGK